MAGARSELTGLSKTMTITSEEIRQAISVPVDAIVAAVRDTLERTPPRTTRRPTRPATAATA